MYGDNELYAPGNLTLCQARWDFARRAVCSCAWLRGVSHGGLSGFVSGRMMVAPRAGLALGRCRGVEAGRGRAGHWTCLCMKKQAPADVPCVGVLPVLAGLCRVVCGVVSPPASEGFV